MTRAGLLDAGLPEDRLADACLAREHERVGPSVNRSRNAPIDGELVLAPDEGVAGIPVVDCDALGARTRAAPRPALAGGT